MATLSEVRLRLLDLHKALVDAARREYERLHGRQTDTAFLEVLLVPDAAGTEFNRKYANLTQQVPEILVAHGAVMRALR